MNKKGEMKTIWLSCAAAILILIIAVRFSHIRKPQSNNIGEFRNSDAGSMAAQKKITLDCRKQPNVWFFSARWRARDSSGMVVEEELDYDRQEEAFSRYIRDKDGSWDMSFKIWIKAKDVLQGEVLSTPLDCPTL